jgi:hypothetical protein
MRTTFPEMVQRARVNLGCGPVGDIPETGTETSAPDQRSYRHVTGQAKHGSLGIDVVRVGGGVACVVRVGVGG